MMETVLNIGLNDASVKGLAEAAATNGSPGTPTAGCCRCSARPCWTCPARCSPTRWTRPRRPRASTSDLDLDVDDLKALVEVFKDVDPRALRRRVPAASAGTAGPGDPRGLRLLEHRPGPAVPAPRAHPAGPGHRGQHLHHGVRQPRRDQRHRRRLHPRPGVRQEPAPTATTCANAQGEDVVAGIRNTLTLDDLAGAGPGLAPAADAR